MGLSDRDFKGDVETCKDLEGVWKEFGLGGLGDGASEEERNREGAARTILLDDEPSKAVRYSTFTYVSLRFAHVWRVLSTAGSTTTLTSPHQTFHSTAL